MAEDSFLHEGWVRASASRDRLLHGRCAYRGIRMGRWNLCVTQTSQDGRERKLNLENGKHDCCKVVCHFHRSMESICR